MKYTKDSHKKASDLKTQTIKILDDGFNSQLD